MGCAQARMLVCSKEHLLTYEFSVRKFSMAHQLIMAEVDLLQCHTTLKRLKTADHFVVVQT